MLKKNSFSLKKSFFKFMSQILHLLAQFYPLYTCGSNMDLDPQHWVNLKQNDKYAMDTRNLRSTMY